MDDVIQLLQKRPCFENVWALDETLVQAGMLNSDLRAVQVTPILPAADISRLCK